MSIHDMIPTQVNSLLIALTIKRSEKNDYCWKNALMWPELSNAHKSDTLINDWAKDAVLSSGEIKYEKQYN